MKLNPVPLYWRRQTEIFLHNLRTRDPARRVHARRVGSVVRLEVGGEAIFITSIGRWKRYRRGLAAKLDDVARRYGALPVRDAIRGGTVVDIGANVGEFSLWCSRIGCRVVAVEPDPTNFLALQENARDTAITLCQRALWDKEEELTFYSAVARADSSLIEPEEFSRSFTVRTTTLDRLCAERSVGPVAFIKGDAEGAEPEVLRGAVETLARTRYIAIDCGPERRGEKTFGECSAILSGLGFATRALDAEGNMLFGENRALVLPGADR